MRQPRKYSFSTTDVNEFVRWQTILMVDDIQFEPIVLEREGCATIYRIKFHVYDDGLPVELYSMVN